MSSLKLSSRGIGILCPIAGILIGIVIAAIVTYFAVDGDLTEDGRYVELSYCKEEAYLGDEICTGGSDCEPVATCIGGWGVKKVPVWEHVRDIVGMNVFMGMFFGFFAGGVVALGINDNIKRNQNKTYKYNDK